MSPVITNIQVGTEIFSVSGSLVTRKELPHHANFYLEHCICVVASLCRLKFPHIFFLFFDFQNFVVHGHSIYLEISYGRAGCQG